MEGREILRKEDLDSWFLDPDIVLDPEDYEGVANTEPLLVNLKDTWRLRPEAVTAIPNFFLASDYVRTYTDLATMEGANEAARRAVNGIIAASGSNASLCSLWKLHEPGIFQPFRDYDRTRWEAGLPWDDRWVSVASSVLEVSPKSGRTFIGKYRLCVRAEQAQLVRSIGPREVTGESGSTEADVLLQVSRQILSLVEGVPIRAVLPSDAQEQQNRPWAMHPPRETRGSTAAVPPPRRGRIRIVQKQS